MVDVQTRPRIMFVHFISTHRFKLTTRSQVPEFHPPSSNSTSSDPLTETAPNAMPHALSHYLTDLKMRPADDVSFVIPDDPRHSILDTNSAPHHKSHSRNPSLTIPTRPNSTHEPAHTISTPENIESNSFLYIEMLLEALAVLGTLGSALDTVNQRLGIEIFTIVEGVMNDVHERAEFVRRGLEQTPGPGSNTSAGTTPGSGGGGGLYVFVGEGPGALRLAALEGAAKKADHEILRDLCWTLYSKLDAVVQGLRVVSEVADRIGSVSF